MIFADRLGLFLTRTAITTLATITSAARWTITAVATFPPMIFTLFPAFATRLVVVMRTFVRMHRRRMMRMILGRRLRIRFFAFAEAQHLLQT